MVASVCSDRYCIYSNQTYKEKLSPEYLVGCAEQCNERPQIDKSFDHALIYGIPTGGPYNSNQGCLPYEQEPCKHTKDSYLKMRGAKDEKVCSKDAAFQHECVKNCSNVAHPESLDQDLKTLQSWYTIFGYEDFIMPDIITYGPLITSMPLYDDFIEHPTGVYKTRPDAKYLGQEKFIKLIGWGEENDTKYWLAVNTWDNWGTSKVFKLARSENGDMMLASTGDFNSFWYPEPVYDESVESDESNESNLLQGAQKV